MRFEIRDGLVVFHDNEPRSNVWMRGPRGVLPFNGGASLFSDQKREYAWAFDRTAEPKDGDQFAFMSIEREAVGEFKDGAITILTEEELLARPAAGLIVTPRKPKKSGLRIMAVFPGIQSPGAGWNTLSHASANNESAYMAHGMSYISAYLKSRGHDVWLLDTRGFRNWGHFIDEVKRQEYDFAMLGPLSIEAFTSACIVRILKETHPRRPVIFGGLHVSMTKDKVFPPNDLPKFYFYQEPPSRMKEYLALKGEAAFDPDRWPKADYLVWNEGELATAAIVEGQDLKAGDWDYEVMPGGTVFMNGKIVPDLNKMPHMDRSLFNEEMEKQHPLLPELPAPFHTITFGRGCPYKCSFSVTGDTIVFTEDGPVSIASLAAGIGSVRACVHGASTIDYRVERAVATPGGRGIATLAAAEGVQPVIQVTTEGGFKIKATPGHQFLCIVDEKETWRHAEDLRPRDFMVVRSPEREWPLSYQPLTPPVLSNRAEAMNTHRCPKVLDERLAWLCGFMIGDGCIPSDGRAAFHFCVFPNLEAKQRDIVQQLFGVSLKTYPVQHSTKLLHGWVHSRLAREVLIQSIGIGIGDDKLTIPAIFWRSPKTVLAAFIDGLYDADAYAPEGGHEYLTTVSEKLAREVSYALLMLGRGCPNVQFIERGSGYGEGDHYRIGLLHNDRLPSSQALYKSSKSGVWHWRTKRSKSVIGIRRRTLRESGLHHQLDKDGWYYVQVRTVTECLAEPVFDLVVPGEESFVANGLVAHNCSVGVQYSSSSVRLLDPDYFMDALHEIKHRNGGHIGSMMVHDDILLFPKWIREWNEKIKQQFGYISYWCQMRADFIVNNPDLIRHMAEAGMTWVSVGYEVGHARGLTGIMNKGLKVIGINDPVEINIKAAETLRSLNVNSFGNFMFGNPTETNDEMDATVRMIQKIQPQHHGFSTYAGYPGTPMEDLVDREGLRTSEWYTRSHYPWQYRLKGVDYEHVNRCIQIAAQTPRQYMNPIKAGIRK